MIVRPDSSGRLRSRLAVLCLVLAALPVWAGDKQAKRPITLEDLWKVKRLGKPSLSPDGKWAAVDVTSYSMDDNSSTSHLWLCPPTAKRKSN